MGDGLPSPRTGASAPPVLHAVRADWTGEGEVLAGAMLEAMTARGESISVIAPVRDDGVVVDFVIVADTGLTERLSGRPSLGRSIRELYASDVAEDFVRRNAEVLERGEVEPQDFPLGLDAAGLRLPPAPGEDEPGVELRQGVLLRIPVRDRVVVMWRDLTDVREAERHRRQAEELLQQQALTDHLTGLPNRRWFTAALRDAVGRAAATGTPLVLLVLDVDDFKDVNDTHGHAAGDLLLVEMSARLAAALTGPGVAVARLGGDELVVVAEGHGPADEERLAALVADAVQGAYRLGAVAVEVTLSVGVVSLEPSGQAPADRRAQELLGAADVALYEAKRRGRARHHAFTPELGARVQHRAELGGQLRQAAARGELTLHWQPIVRLADGVPVAAEALLRWQHPARGLVPAGQFLPVAAELGLLPELAAWAVDAAFAQAAAWQRRGAAPHVYVNLAASQLASVELGSELARLAAAHGVDRRGVSLELSEEVLGTDVEAVGARMQHQRAAGFSIALDDFGAGSTALTWLRRLPLDVLKLDRSFAASVDEERTRTVVRAIIGLAHDLGVRTVAEGVETAAQRDFFAAARCDYAQGWLLGRPVPADVLLPAR